MCVCAEGVRESALCAREHVEYERYIGGSIEELRERIEGLGERIEGLGERREQLGGRIEQQCYGWIVFFLLQSLLKLDGEQGKPFPPFF